MNTVIFLTKDNKEEMAESIRLLATKQHDIVNGALVVCHQSCISEKEAKRIASPLSAKFKAGGLVKSASNVSLSHDGQIAVMFARFVALAYIRFPGPWLIIDESTGVRVDNWAKAALDQHNLYGGKVVSCAKREGKSLLTYGPLSVHLNVKTMKMLHFATGESWRSRGRFLLMNAGLRAVEPEKSVFCAMGQPAPAVDYAGPPEKLTAERQELSDAIERLTGKKPHHFTGIDKLREMVQQLEQPVSV